jgi:hypothetical protein
MLPSRGARKASRARGETLRFLVSDDPRPSANRPTRIQGFDRIIEIHKLRFSIVRA